MNRGLSAAITCVAIASTSVVWAEPSLQTQVSARQVEVGEPFQVQVTCNLDGSDESPSAPRLPVPPGVSVEGPSVSSQHSFSFVNGVAKQSSGVVLTWNLTASNPGKLRIGPPSVIIDGKRFVARAVDVTVVPAASSRSRRGSRRGMQPPLGGFPLGGWTFPSIPGLDLDPDAELEPIPAHPPEFDLDKAKDPTAFLDARANPKRVVLGEQLRLDIYLYNKSGAGEPTNPQEPNLDGFLSFRSELDDPLARPHPVKIGEQRFFARKIISYALIPTKTGPLTIGPMKLGFVPRSLFGQASGQAFERASEPITIIVEEPPLAGRPAAYHLGDVGQFSLSATVEPRQVKVGESVSVQLEVTGRGQLPQKLDPPEQTGVDWLEPSVTQELDEQQGKLGGRRQFSYVVRLNREGNIDLGQMRLAYFDPTKRAYAFAKANLGSIQVNPSTAAPKDETSTSSTTGLSQDPDAFVLIPRGKLGTIAPIGSPLADRPGFFFWLGLGPAITALFFALKHGISKARSLRNRWSTSTKALLEAEFEQARRALVKGDPTQVSGHVERAVHLLIEARTGIRSRGLLREELPAALVATGLQEQVAAQLVDLLERCDELRFVQADPRAASELLADATTRIRAALAAAKSRPGAQP